jgi:hypothetical protein
MTTTLELDEIAAGRWLAAARAERARRPAGAAKRWRGRFSATLGLLEATNQTTDQRYGTWLRVGWLAGLRQLHSLHAPHRSGHFAPFWG